MCLLSETWTNERCDLHLPGYNYKAIHRTIKKRGTVRDSGGLLLYFKSERKDAVEILHNFEDHFLWIKLSGDKLGWDNDIFVCLCNVIPRSSSRQDLVETHAFDRISNDIANFHVRYGDKFSCLIVGDMNSRTGESKDYVENDNTGYVPVPDDYTEDDDVPHRTSCDKKAPDEYGHKLIDLCKTCSLRIVNGRVGSDKGVGNYTSINKRGQSVVDYVLCESNIFKLLNDFAVNEICEWSDHCKLSFSLKIKYESNTSADKIGKTHKFKWNSTKREDFLTSLNNVLPEVRNSINYLTNDMTEGNVNKTLDIITTLIQNK